MRWFGSIIHSAFILGLLTSSVCTSGDISVASGMIFWTNHPSSVSTRRGVVFYHSNTSNGTTTLSSVMNIINRIVCRYLMIRIRQILICLNSHHLSLSNTRRNCKIKLRIAQWSLISVKIDRNVRVNTPKSTGSGLRGDRQLSFTRTLSFNTKRVCWAQTSEGSGTTTTGVELRTGDLWWKAAHNALTLAVIAFIQGLGGVRSGAEVKSSLTTVGIDLTVKAEDSSLCPSIRAPRAGASVAARSCHGSESASWYDLRAGRGGAWNNEFVYMGPLDCDKGGKLLWVLSWGLEDRLHTCVL